MGWREELWKWFGLGDPDFHKLPYPAVTADLWTREIKKVDDRPDYPRITVTFLKNGEVEGEVVYFETDKGWFPLEPSQLHDDQICGFNFFGHLYCRLDAALQAEREKVWLEKERLKAKASQEAV